MLVPGAKEWIRSTHAMVLLIGVVMLFLVSIIQLVCCKEASQWPRNYAWAFVFTLSSAYLFSTICVGFKNQQVVEAFALTCGISFAATLFAWRTRQVFTFFSPIRFIGGCILAILAVLWIIFTEPFANILWALLFAIFFAVYLILDT